MQKKIVLFSAIVLLMMSGCNKKTPQPSDNISNAGDTISIDESALNGKNGMNGMNGSSDGMKSIYFGFGDYGVSSEMQGTVAFNADVLKNKLQSGKVKLEGNCDEFGTDEYNYALGLKRAKAVQEGLQGQGISTGQIVLVSFGESNPQCSEATDDCYGQNRRVDLHLLR